MEKVRRCALTVLAVVACNRPQQGAGSRAHYDVLLTGGWIVDGSENPRWRCDVAITVRP